MPASTYYDFCKRKDGNAARPSPKRGRAKRFPLQDQLIIKIVNHLRENQFMQTEGGYRKLSLYLKRDYKIICNHKRMYRICKENGLLLPKVKKRRVRLRKICTSKKITRPNKLWEFDIKYGYIHGENRFYFLCAFIDVFTRDIIDYHIGLRCTAEDILRTLKLALIKENITTEHHLVIRSDNGPQMTSKLFEKTISKLPPEHEFIPIRTPNLNAHIESFFSQVETNVMAAEYFYSFRQAYKRVMEFIDYYRSWRIHGSLKMAPKEFRSKQNELKLENYAVCV